MSSRVARLWNTASSQNTLFEGIIARDATSVSEPVEVVVPAYDPNRVFASAPWMPRGVDLPTEGDRCIVALGESDIPGTPEPWVIAWWPYDD